MGDTDDPPLFWSLCERCGEITCATKIVRLCFDCAKAYLQAGLDPNEGGAGSE